VPMHERPWLLLPVKSLRRGKQRLKHVLSDAERLRLNEFLFRRMIAVAAAFPGLERTFVVSDATDSLQLAGALGASLIRTESQDLNGALTEGHRELRKRGAKRILILPIDIPLTESSDLREIARIGERHHLVICPDHRRMGTNALFISGKPNFQFKFGAQSYAGHQLEARRCGSEPALHYNVRIAMDIDDPVDLEVLAMRDKACGELIHIHSSEASGDLPAPTRRGPCAGG
jgi:2-phospho-L-lactate/phosphoenolpyruvate guanylyltransferase